MREVEMSVKNKKWKARKRKNRDVLAPYLGESLIISGNVEFYTNTINKGITGPAGDSPVRETETLPRPNPE